MAFTQWKCKDSQEKWLVIKISLVYPITQEHLALVRKCLFHTSRIQYLDLIFVFYAQKIKNFYIPLEYAKEGKVLASQSTQIEKARKLEFLVFLFLLHQLSWKVISNNYKNIFDERG